MGLEFVDLTFRLESKYGIGIDADGLLEHFSTRQPFDITVQELLEHIHAECHLICTECRYLLRGLPAKGRCPECGKPYPPDPMPSVDELIELCAEVTGHSVDQIRPDMWLVADLGFG